MHNIANAIIVAGFILLGLAVIARLRYGPKKIFGRYTSEIVCAWLLVFGVWNLFLWWRHGQMDVWDIVVTITAFVACIGGYIDLVRKRRAR